MTSVMVSNLMDNVFQQSRTMPGSVHNRLQQQHMCDSNALQHLSHLNNASMATASCGSRSRLMSLPLSTSDHLSAAFSDNQQSYHQSRGAVASPGCYNGTAAFHRQLQQQQRQFLSSSDDDLSPTSNQHIGVFEVAKALAQFQSHQPPPPPMSSTVCSQSSSTSIQVSPRSKNILERSMSMPTEDASLKYQQQQLQMQQQSMINASAAAASLNSVNTTTSRYKTEMCRPFEEHGFCKYGDKCQFAHGIQELRTVTRHPKYKTELCRTFHTVGFCAYGSRCHFVHNEEERGTLVNSGPPHHQSHQQRASPPLPAVKTSSVPAAAAYLKNTGAMHEGAKAMHQQQLPMIRCGSLGSTADSSPPASPVDCYDSAFINASRMNQGAVMSSGSSSRPLNIVTIDTISALFAKLQSSDPSLRSYTSPPSPPDSLSCGSDGCYELSSSSAESSPTKCVPSAYYGHNRHHPLSFSYTT